MNHCTSMSCRDFLTLEVFGIGGVLYALGATMQGSTHFEESKFLTTCLPPGWFALRHGPAKQVRKNSCSCRDVA